MCGIAGCYQQADGQKLVDIMTDRIAHRGPDASGSRKHEDGRVTVHLGHRRPERLGSDGLGDGQESAQIERIHVVADNRQEQVFLVVEVVVGSPFADSGALEDAIEGGVLVAVGAELLGGGIHERGSALGREAVEARAGHETDRSD